MACKGRLVAEVVGMARSQICFTPTPPMHEP